MVSESIGSHEDDDAREKYPPEDSVVLLGRGGEGKHGRLFYKGNEPWVKMELDGGPAELRLVPHGAGLGIKTLNTLANPPLEYTDPVYIQGENIYHAWDRKMGTVLQDQKTGHLVIAYKGADGYIDPKSLTDLEDPHAPFGTVEQHMSLYDMARIRNLDGKAVVVGTVIPYSDMNPSAGHIPQGKYTFRLERSSSITLIETGGKRYESVPIECLRHLHQVF